VDKGAYYYTGFAVWAIIVALIALVIGGALLGCSSHDEDKALDPDCHWDFERQSYWCIEDEEVSGAGAPPPAKDCTNDVIYMLIIAFLVWRAWWKI
jgi:hypothetical protein